MGNFRIARYSGQTPSQYVHNLPEADFWPESLPVSGVVRESGQQVPDLPTLLSSGVSPLVGNVKQNLAPRVYLASA
ncbi:MAG: hypothetical protein JWN74_462 [Acidobacteriaceae bacterium]|nr:hypothetical protein [Acidobacteriaceae bacterium]